MKIIASTIAGLIMLSNGANAQSIYANKFSCVGDEFQVEYASTSVTGKQNMSLMFHGEAIQIGQPEAVQTKIGTEISASRLDLPSDVWIDFTLVLPRIQLASTDATKEFSTMLIQTTSAGPIPPTVTIAMPENSFTPVMCTASFDQL